MRIYHGVRRAQKLFRRYLPETVALTIAASAVPLAAGWVPPNWAYGFRTPRTLSSLEEWYRANHLMGYYMLASQAIAIASMGLVSDAMRSRFGRDRVAWGVAWACVTSLVGIGACAIHYAKFG